MYFKATAFVRRTRENWPNFIPYDAAIELCHKVVDYWTRQMQCGWYEIRNPIKTKIPFVGKNVIISPAEANTFCAKFYGIFRIFRIFRLTVCSNSMFNVSPKWHSSWGSHTLGIHQWRWYKQTNFLFREIIIIPVLTNDLLINRMIAEWSKKKREFESRYYFQPMT